jgi:ComF family protein
MSLDVVRSAGRHAHWLRGAVLSFKYHGERQRARHLGACAAPWLDPAWNVDAIVPVPLHGNRERERGYNQAALLAREIGATHALPVTASLVRTVDTPQQVGLNAAARRRNLFAAFALGPGANVAGRRLLLIDDVMTTGSTLGACAETLLVAGAAWVGGLTVSREG